ncbi:MAG: hypothetical protein Q8M22_18740, partial [Actinomycetota bacterium]|nr:hypothetical protein [Actinomycetota bacterium]
MADQVADHRVVDRGAAVAVVVDGRKEPLLDVEHAGRRPSGRAVICDRDDLWRGEYAGDDPVDGGDRCSLTDSGDDCFDEVGPGEGGVVVGERPAKILDPVLRGDDLIDGGAADRILDGESPDLVVADSAAGS